MLDFLPGKGAEQELPPWSLPDCKNKEMSYCSTQSFDVKAVAPCQDFSNPFFFLGPTSSVDHTLGTVWSLSLLPLAFVRLPTLSPFILGATASHFEALPLLTLPKCSVTFFAPSAACSVLLFSISPDLIHYTPFYYYYYSFIYYYYFYYYCHCYYYFIIIIFYRSLLLWTIPRALEGWFLVREPHQ